MNKFFVEEPKNMIINLIISFVVILATVAFAGLSGSDLVIQTAWYILIIHWIAFLPALIFKTEKFYDLTGSICYAFGSVFVYYQTYGATFSLSLFISIAVLIWTIRLGSFLLKRVLDAGEDKRFRTIKKSPTQFFMTFNLFLFIILFLSLLTISILLTNNVDNYFRITIFFIGMSILLFHLIFQIKNLNVSSTISALKTFKSNRNSGFIVVLTLIGISI